MSDIRIVKPIAVLSGSKDGWQKELNIVSVDGGPLSYDIREWRLDRFDYRDGISLSEEEAQTLLMKLGECFQVNVSELGTSQIAMPAVVSGGSEEVKKPKIADILKEKGISFIDKRDLGGALWIIGAHELDGLMEELKAQGFKFYFSEKGGKTTKGQPAWFIQKKDV